MDKPMRNENRGEEKLSVILVCTTHYWINNIAGLGATLSQYDFRLRFRVYLSFSANRRYIRWIYCLFDRNKTTS